MSLIPRHLSPKPRRASASSDHDETWTEISPRLVRITSPWTPIQSPRFSLTNSENSPVSAAVANSCTAPLQSRSSAKATLPWGRLRITLPATRTTTPDEAPGSRWSYSTAMPPAGIVSGERVGDLRLTRGPAVDLVGWLLLVRHGPSSDSVFLAKSSRRPCNVSQGSTCWTALAWGLIRPESPPVAITVAVPISSWIRWQRPSTSAA